jgi:aminoglycoside phosphotransferase (APT) family kinase protein
MAFKSATETVRQDWTSLAGYLARFGAELRTTEPRQFAGGLGNLNYLVEINGSPAVLRRPPSGPLPPGANDMGREHRILSALWRAYPLAPRSLFYCEDPRVLGAPFQILEYRDGIVVRGQLPSDLSDDPKVGAVLSRQLVESLGALHSVDPDRVGLGSLGRPAGFLGRTLEGWARRGAALVDPINRSAFTGSIAWLRRRVPADCAPCLLHSDFKLDNLILRPKTLDPVAVIDWDMGTRGDPLWDLAVLLSYWAEPGDPDCMHRLRQMPTLQAGFWSRRQVIDAYRRLTGRSVDSFDFYRVLSVFRTAIVFLQLFERYRREPGSNLDCIGFDTIGRDLLDYAFEIASGRAE